MNQDERLSEMLLLWEELKGQGRPISATELCRDCPDLVPALEEQIQAICEMGALLGDGTDRQLETHTLHDTLAGQAQLSETDRHQVMSTQTNYQVLRSHAKGGLGEVLVAHDELLGREVALKVIRQPHDRDPERRRRFVREAEITGRLEHPGIVPIHGIGQDNRGRLCYAMRLISGESMQEAIHKFHHSPDVANDDHTHNLALRRLLGRFVSVCNTIAYAHSQGIVHRDLKPANIMLGAFGETLVVDWGLAKRIKSEEESRGNDSSLTATEQASSESHTSGSAQLEAHGDHATRAGQTLGTPAFMSPEQSRGDLSQLGPASDVYSLGATIYMLLTGRPPFEGRNLADLLQSVRKGAFLPPQRVKRGIPPALNAICLKAMALHPQDRYSSALELAGDIEKWLADEPVSAHQEPFSVRWRRWTRRHRLIVTSAAASLIVGIISLAVLLMFMSRANDKLNLANQQERQAKAAADQNAAAATRNATLAEHQSELALRSLQSVTFDIQRQLKNVPAAHKVRHRLLDTALQGLAEVAASLEQRPQVDRSLLVAHRDLGDLFFEVGNEPTSGGTIAARTQYQRAFDIAQTLASAEPTNTEIQRQLAICHDKLGDISARSGSTAAAQEHFRSSLAIRERLVAENPTDEQVHRDVSVSLNRLGDMALKAGAVEEAAKLFRRALEIRQQQAARNVADPEMDRDFAISYNKLGDATLRMGETEQALEFFKQGLTVNRRRAEQLPDDSEALRGLSSSYSRLGHACWTLGNYQQANDYFQQSLEIDERQVAADPTNSQSQHDLMQSSEMMADAQGKLGHRAAAEIHVKKMVSICEQLVAADPNDSRSLRDLAVAYVKLGDLFAESEKHEEAIQWYRKALTIRQQRAARDPSDPRGPSDVAMGLTKLGDGLLAGQQVDEALQNYGEALKIHEQRCAVNPTDTTAQSNLAAYHQRIGVACRRCGKFDDAQKHYQQALQVSQNLSQLDPKNIPVKIMIVNFYHSLGFLEQSRERYAEATRWYEQGLALARQLSEEKKLIGDDATWVSYIEDAMRQCQQAQQAKSTADK